jgi:acetolactate synthase-1/2/3 large subunit
MVHCVIDELANCGIDTYFLVTGGAIAPFVDAVGVSARAKYYCFQHEQGAAMAAEGYYRASGKIPAVLVTSGPGVQNIVNGLCGCWYDSIPCLFITGQVSSKESLDTIQSRPRQVGFQEMPVVEMLQSFTKFATKIQNVDQVQDVFSSAISSMVSGRPGPALIDFPVNLQMEMSKVLSVKFTIQIETLPGLDVPETVRDLISSAERPVVVVGNGARGSDFLNWINVPFVTTWAAVDLVAHNHPLRIGSLGVYGDRVANYAVQNADLLVILGSRLDTRQTGGNLGLFSRQSKRIMVDIDADEMTKLDERGLAIDVKLHGTVSSFLKCVGMEPRPDWLATLGGWKAEFGVEVTREGNVYPFLEGLKLPEECIIIPDQGGNLIWTIQSLKLTGGQRLFTNLGNSSMGWSLPAAIGAAIGTNGRVPIVCIEGDGGIHMNIQELRTLETLHLPVTVIILNNAGYGIIRQFQDSYFSSRYIATSCEDVAGVDFVRVAEAYNLRAFRTLDVTVSDNGPVVYDAPIDPGQRIFPKLEFGNSLENMTPYRTELHKYMVVPPVAPNAITGWK